MPIRGWKIKLAAALVVVLLAVAGEAANPVNAQAYLNSSPGLLTLIARLTPAQSEAIYGEGCDAKHGGVIPTFAEAGNVALSGIESSTITCILNDTELTPTAKAALLTHYPDGSPRAGIGTTAFQLPLKILEQRPASAVVFASEQLNRFLTAGVVYADPGDPAEAYFPGTGYELLAPIQSFWGWAVTISYSFMVLIIIVVALGLIFRARLSGEQVVQLQNTLPGIVMAMILIPLSYPIAGLFIDGIQVGTNTIHDFVFSPIGPGGDVYRNDSEFNGNKFSDGRGLYADDPRINFFNARLLIGIGRLSERLADSSVCSETGTDPEACQSLIQTGAIYSIFSGILGLFNTTVGDVIAGLVYFVFTVITIITALKIGWKLFKQFLTLIVIPLALPFVFATLAVPGFGNKLVVDQLKRMLNATLHFIVTYGMFLFAIVLTAPSFVQSIGSGIGVSKYIPPLFNGTFVGPLFSSTIGAVEGTQGTLVPVLFLLLGAAVYLSIPSVLAKLTATLGPKGELPFKAALSELQSSSEVALRQAPALVATAGSNFAAGTAGRFGSYLGNKRDPNDPYGDTKGESYVKKQAERIANLRNRAENATGLEKLRLNRQADLAEARGRARAAFYGQAGKLTPQSGEEGGRIEVQLEMPSLGYPEGKSGTTIAFNLRSNSVPSNATGNLVILPAQNSTVTGGPVYIGRISTMTGGEIGELTDVVGSGSPTFVKVASTFSNEKGALKITDPKRYFVGSGKVKIPITIDLSGYVGQTATLQLSSPIWVSIDDPTSSKLRAPVGFVIQIN